MSLVSNNACVNLDIRIRQREPFARLIRVSGADWSGDYDGQILTQHGSVVANLEVDATYADEVTDIMVSLSQESSDGVDPGMYSWALRASTGEVRVRGAVIIDEELVPVD